MGEVKVNLVEKQIVTKTSVELRFNHEYFVEGMPYLLTSPVGYTVVGILTGIGIDCLMFVSYTGSSFWALTGDRWTEPDYKNEIVIGLKRLKAGEYKIEQLTPEKLKGWYDRMGFMQETKEDIE